MQRNDRGGLVQRALDRTLFAHPDALRRMPRKRRFKLISEHKRNLEGLAPELLDWRRDDGESIDDEAA